MSSELSLNEIKKEWHGTFKAYMIGFFSSLFLTGLSFFLVIERLFSEQNLMYVILALAIVQAIVQLLFFLHVGQEAKPRWESVVFGFTVLILLIVAIGSIWVMHDLKERVMPEMTHTPSTNP